MHNHTAPYRLRLIMVALLLSCTGALHAQFAKSPHVKRDPRVDLLVDKQIELNRLAMKTKTVILQGYRIQVISTNKRDLALETKSRLLKSYPDQKSYMFYQSPHFKIQFGNFKTYKEAEQFKKEMTSLFGEELLILPSRVEIKGEQLENENQ